MKLRSLLLAASLMLFAGVGVASIPLGGSIFPLTYITQPPINLTDSFNQMLSLINQQTVGISTTYAGAMLEPPAGVDTSQAVFSTTQQGNPLVLDTYSDTFVSTAGLYSTGYTTILASLASRKIFPTAGLSIMVSGTAATATGLALECSGGTLLASWPIADLVDQLPVGTAIYKSTLAPIATGAAITKGCGQNEAVYLSNVGTQITTTTHVYVNLPYTVQ